MLQYAPKYNIFLQTKRFIIIYSGTFLTYDILIMLILSANIDCEISIVNIFSI
jgi:hypothetical protein